MGTQKPTNVPEAPLQPVKPKIYKPQLAQYLIKMLIYGSAGVGKTSLAATANSHPLTAPILFINVEGGILSIADAKVLGLKEVPDVTDLEDFAKMENLFWWLAKGDHQYKSVCIDTLSELQLKNLDAIVQNQIGKTSQSGARREDIDDVWQDDYGKSTQQLRRLMRKFRDLPMHVFFTCHDATDKNGENVFPALTPKLRTSVLGYMDIVGFLYVQDVKTTVPDDEGEQTEQTITMRRLLCQPLGKWTAKDRSPGGRLGTVLDNPSVPKIMDLIIGSK